MLLQRHWKEIEVVYISLNKQLWQAIMPLNID